MSFLSAQRARLGTLLLGWVPIGGMLAAIALSQGWPWPSALTMTVPLCALGAVLFTSARYLALAFPLRRGNPIQRWGAWTLASTAMGGLWSGGAWLVARWLGTFEPLKGLPQRVAPALPVLTGFGILLYLASLGLHYLLQAQKQAQEAEAQQMELRLLAQDAELKALRAQINPHFLFNSLNSISALTTLDPSRAREMCVLLSDFLRKSLGLGERQSVSLREELDLVRAYLSIEQTRFGERLKVEWAVTPEAEDLQLPPLLLQPLAENAIKHGISALPEGGVLRISAQPEGADVRVVVENPCDPDAPAPKGLGLGLRQVRERLRGRFATRGRFEAHIRDCLHTVTLVIPKEPS